MSSSDEKIIEDAQKLYNKGKWSKAIDLIDSLFFSHDEQKVAETNRIKGWSYYYLGIKGDESYKMENMGKAEEYFRLALIKMRKEKGLISILNGLPLVLWILGKKKEAELESFKAAIKFPQEPSIWNTKAILYRWANNWRESVNICEKVYEMAIEKKDFRTAGNGKQNKADALVRLGRTEEGKQEYQKALKIYKKYEKKTGESASFHLERVQEKLSNL